MFSRQQFAELLELTDDWRGDNLLDLGIQKHSKIITWKAKAVPQ